MASLWLVTGLCVLVPVVYVGFIFALGWLELHYYAEWAPDIGRGFAIFRMMAWVIPGFTGTVLILFLIKPLFAARPKLPDALQLKPGEEAAFANAIRSLCAAMGIRAPTRIGLSHQANAWVQFDGGLFGFLLGRKRVTVGMPLVASLTSRQLVGVLAHEFGHFAQGGGMRCSYIINSVNGWLHSRAYQHDAWDDRLENWMERTDSGLLQLLAWVTGWCLMLTRWFMHLLFQLSFRMSRKLSQQMEFDADRYEAVIAGSSCFRDTALRMRGLMRATAETDRVNAAAWREGRLVDDLPAATDARLQRMEPKEWQQIALDLASDHDTQFWSSHPADQERIANVEQLGSLGLFLDERPARQIFEDFPALARRVTAHYYKDMGLNFGPRNLIDVQQLWKINRLDDDLSATWARYSNGMVGDAHFLSPEEAKYKPASDFDWQGSVDELRRIGPDSTGLWQRLARRQQRGNELALWVTLIDMDVPFLMPDGREPDRAGLRSEFASCTQDESADDKLAKKILALFARRLQLAVEAMAPAEQAQATKRLALLQALHGHGPKVRQLEQTRQVLLRLVSGMSGAAESLRQTTYQRAQKVRAEWTNLFESMDNLPVDELSLGKHLRNRCGHLSSGGDDPFHFLRAAAPLEDAFLHHYRAVLAELGAQAEAVERERGIRPIKLVLRASA